MGVNAALRARMVATGVNSAVSGRIYQTFPGNAATLPYIVFSKVSDPGYQHQGGAAGIASPIFQVDVWASTNASRDTVSETVRNALDGFSGTVSSVDIRRISMLSNNDTHEDPDDASSRPNYRARMEFQVWYARSVPTLT